MSRHVTYRGATVDMEAMRRENEKTVALGNMGVNAKGDKLRGGAVAKTADQIARENHRVQSVITNAGLKGPVPEAPAGVVMDAPKSEAKVTKSPIKTTAKKEKELPSGDIIIEDGE